jgi:hypothetical protein
MAIRLHFTAEVKNKQGKRVLNIKAVDQLNSFIQRVRRDAKRIDVTEGTMTITAAEWEKGESNTFDL